LTDLPKERIWGELEKLLLKAKRLQSVCAGFIIKCCRTVVSRDEALVGVPQEAEWHPEGDVDVHTLLVVDRARELIDDLPYAKKVTVMLGALCHDLGSLQQRNFSTGAGARTRTTKQVSSRRFLFRQIGNFTINGLTCASKLFSLSLSFEAGRIL
jgi:hypothetical protein